MLLLVGREREFMDYQQPRLPHMLILCSFRLARAEFTAEFFGRGAHAGVSRTVRAYHKSSVLISIL